MPNGDYQCSETAFGVVVHKKYVALLGATEARDFCVADGASVHLPIPRSQEENDWYKAAFEAMSRSGPDYWLGINDVYSEGKGSRSFY